MAVGHWLRVLDTVGTLAQASSRFFRGSSEGDQLSSAAPGAPGSLEARLAGVVVAALKEAFDRDRARMDLERTHLETERQRAEEALRAELRRQAAERALGQLRLITIVAIAAWMLSAALAVLLPGMREAMLPRVLLGLGWLLAFIAVGCGFAGWQTISAWTADGRNSLAAGGEPRAPAAAVAPWLLLAALAFTSLGLLAAL